MFFTAMVGTIFLCNCGLSSPAFPSSFLEMLKTIVFVSDSTDSGLECIWISEWCYINVKSQLDDWYGACCCRLEMAERHDIKKVMQIARDLVARLQELILNK